MPARTSHKARPLSVSDIPADKPIVTLDIDGVLNAFDHGKRLRSWQRPIEDAPTLFRINHRQRIRVPREMCERHGYRYGQSFKITWSDDLMDAIEAAAKAGDATFVWLTSWNEFADFLGWRCFWRGRPSPVLGYLDCTQGGASHAYTGKVGAFEELCWRMESAHPDGDIPGIVAFDDDKPWESRMWNERGAQPMPAFFHGVGTDPRHGITKSQWDETMGLLGNAG